MNKIKKITIPLEYKPGVEKMREFDGGKIQVKTYLVGDVVKKIMLDIYISTNTLNKTGGECECVLCNREPVEPPKPLEGCKNLGGASGSPGVIVGWEEKLEKILHPEESGFKPWWEVNRLVKDFIKADFIERKRVESVIKGIEDESGMDGILDDVKSRLEIGKHD